MKEIYHLRLLLEPAAARLAAVNASDEQLERLRALAAGTAEHDYGGRVRHAHLFHEVLVVGRGGGIHQLVAEVPDGVRQHRRQLGVLEASQRIYFTGIDLADLVDHAGDEHGSLLDALDAGDGEVAEEVARDQVERSRAVVLDRIARTLTDPDPSVRPDAIRIGPPPR